MGFNITGDNKGADSGSGHYSDSSSAGAVSLLKIIGVAIAIIVGVSLLAQFC